MDSTRQNPSQSFNYKHIPTFSRHRRDGFLGDDDERGCLLDGVDGVALEDVVGPRPVHGEHGRQRPGAPLLEHSEQRQDDHGEHSEQRPGAPHLIVATLGGRGLVLVDKVNELNEFEPSVLSKLNKILPKVICSMK